METFTEWWRNSECSLCQLHSAVQTRHGRGPDVNIAHCHLISNQVSRKCGARWTLQRCAKMCKDVQRCAKMCKDVQRCAKMLRTKPANILFHLPRLLEPGNDTYKSSFSCQSDVAPMTERQGCDGQPRHISFQPFWPVPSEGDLTIFICLGRGRVTTNTRWDEERIKSMSKIV